MPIQSNSGVDAIIFKFYELVSTRIGYVYTRAIVPNLPHLYEDETLVEYHDRVNLFTS